jgi:hypothetical protein
VPALATREQGQAHGITITHAMTAYEKSIQAELKAWQRKMVSPPGFVNSLSKKLQAKINRIIPEKIHQGITAAMKQMINAVLFGARITSPQPNTAQSLDIREAHAQEKIVFYRNTAAAEGGLTGAGGILLGLADFPILIGIKLKMLFEIATAYGYDVEEYKERVYILLIFQLAFSSDEHRKNIYLKMVDWDEKKKSMPDSIEQFEWRALQQEYRDYIDLAKMAQLVPGIGAPVGLVVNYRLLKKLGITAMNAYRMRWFGAPR